MENEKINRINTRKKKKTHIFVSFLSNEDKSIFSDLFITIDKSSIIRFTSTHLGENASTKLKKKWERGRGNDHSSTLLVTQKFTRKSLNVYLLFHISHHRGSNLLWWAMKVAPAYWFKMYLPLPQFYIGTNFSLMSFSDANIKYLCQQ